ncbi:sulfite exporter TauE/SafE family protein [Serinicoccus kebangsaanensis]|uniref:sulfite exporter TauE/SafE family protein n=1 Tax=Serinicoccus kebangsaanensis TaxID=2602069 RepID=UPI00124CBE31|nr:sulfite exporter TauE/SafE family protein [Serinicoccus kebangsaanensis]
MTTALLVVLAVAVGAALQRVAGMGLGMTVAPVASVLLGPVAGVTVSNVTAIVAAAILAVLLRGDVDWRRFWTLAPLLVLGSVLGALVVRHTSTAALDIVLGASVLIAIAAVLGLQERIRVTGRGAVLVSGAVGGFMNTTSGVAGPAMAVYAVASRWEHRSFAATLQPIFLLANVASVITKLSLGAMPEPGVVPWWAWWVACAMVPVGIVLGSVVSGRVRTQTARRVAISVAAAGGAIALVRGLVGWLG